MENPCSQQDVVDSPTWLHARFRHRTGDTVDAGYGSVRFFRSAFPLFGSQTVPTDLRLPSPIVPLLLQRRLYFLFERELRFQFSLDCPSISRSLSFSDRSACPLTYCFIILYGPCQRSEREQSVSKRNQEGPINVDCSSNYVR